MNCPHCGQEMPDERPKMLLLKEARYNVPPQALEILELAVKSSTVTKERMVFSLWAAQGKDEPEKAWSVVSVRICKLRKWLHQIGWDLKNISHGGGRGDGRGSEYKLVRT